MKGREEGQTDKEKEEKAAKEEEASTAPLPEKVRAPQRTQPAGA